MIEIGQKEPFEWMEWKRKKKRRKKRKFVKEWQREASDSAGFVLAVLIVLCSESLAVAEIWVVQK